MKNSFVRHKENYIGEFFVREIVAPVFDKTYRNKPIEQRYVEYRDKRKWSDSRTW